MHLLNCKQFAKLDAIISGWMTAGGLRLERVRREQSVSVVVSRWQWLRRRYVAPQAAFGSSAICGKNIEQYTNVA